MAFRKKEKETGGSKKLFHDENLVVKLDEVPDPGFDMCYYQLTPKLINYFEAEVRKSFEYREWTYFLKNHLDINHCSFYKDYSLEAGFTIELHHSPFTLYNIVEAVAMRMMEHDQKVETFLVVEEVNRLHYQFRVGITPLNPTAHELVHNGVLPVHPRIVIGDWKSFYSEYNAYLSEDAMNKYNTAVVAETVDPANLNLKILEYRPTSIEAPKMRHMISMDTLNSLIVDARIAMVEKLGLPQTTVTEALGEEAPLPTPPPPALDIEDIKEEGLPT